MSKKTFKELYPKMKDKLNFLSKVSLVNLQKAGKIGKISNKHMTSKSEAIKKILEFDVKNKYLICKTIFNNPDEYSKRELDDMQILKTFEYDQLKLGEEEINVADTISFKKKNEPEVQVVEKVVEKIIKEPVELVQKENEIQDDEPQSIIYENTTATMEMKTMNKIDSRRNEEIFICGKCKNKHNHSNELTNTTITNLKKLINDYDNRKEIENRIMNFKDIEQSYELKLEQMKKEKKLNDVLDKLLEIKNSIDDGNLNFDGRSYCSYNCPHCLNNKINHNRRSNAGLIAGKYDFVKPRIKSNLKRDVIDAINDFVEIKEFETSKQGTNGKVLVLRGI